MKIVHLPALQALHADASILVTSQEFWKKIENKQKNVSTGNSCPL